MAAPGGTCTGLALPASPASGPLLSGRPVVGGKSDLRGTEACTGLGAAATGGTAGDGCVCGVDANTTDPPSEPLSSSPSLSQIYPLPELHRLLASLSRSRELSGSRWATDEAVKRSEARPLSSEVLGSTFGGSDRL